MTRNDRRVPELAANLRSHQIKIPTAYERIGQRLYERLRALAMALLLRDMALRIGEVATLAKDRVRGDEIYLRATKNSKVVKLPVHPELRQHSRLFPSRSAQ